MTAIEFLLPRPSQIRPIRTPRLLLRPFQWTDVDDFVKLRSTPEVMQWTSQGRIDDSLDQTKQWMQKFILPDNNNDEHPRENYNFAVFLRNNNTHDDIQEKEEGAFIGVCGLVALNSLPVSSRPIFGYMFLPEAWGKGYGTEAVRGFQDAWREILAASQLDPADVADVGIIHAVTVSTNLASMKILRKCGWVEDDTVPKKEGIVWSVQLPPWLLMSLPQRPVNAPSSRREETQPGFRESSRRRRRDIESGTYTDVPQSPYSPTSPRRHSTHRRHVSHSSARGAAAPAPEASPALGRKRSLVRPERRQLDPDHPNYHYQQHAQNYNMATYPSTTGHDPILDTHAEADTGSTDSSLKTGNKSNLYGAEGNLNKPMERIERQPSSREKRKIHRKSSKKRAVSQEKRQQKAREQARPPSLWYAYCATVTFWAPDFVLKCFGMPQKDKRRAWREKMGLISVILLICTFVGFLTFGFTEVVCGSTSVRLQVNQVDSGYMIFHGEAYDLSRSEHPPAVGITAGSNVLYDLGHKYGGQDGSFFFQNVNGACKDVITLADGSDVPTNSDGDLAWYFPCQPFNQDGSSTPNKTIPYYFGYSCHLSGNAREAFYGLRSSGDVFFTWDDLKNKSRNLIVYSGNVLDLTLIDWFNSTQVSYPALFDQIRSNSDLYGTDVTYAFQSSEDKRIAKCLSQVIKVGSIDTKTIGCIASQVVLYVSLIFILSIVAAKFFMAVMFHWFLSRKFAPERTSMTSDRKARAQQIEDWTDDIYRPAPRLTEPPAPDRDRERFNKRASFLPTTSRFSSPYAVAGAGGKTKPTTMVSQNSTSRLVPTTTTSGSMYKLGPNSSNATLSADAMSRHNDSDSKTSLMISQSDQRHSTLVGSSEGPAGFIHEAVVPQPPPEWQPFGFPLAHTMCLVTCYSEGEEGIRTTLDSVAMTDYPNSHKTIIVICDGIIKGKGEEFSTPEIVIGMMHDFVVPPEEVQPYSYVAVASGSKRHNMAKIYAGFYDYGQTSIVPPEKQQRVPMMVIVKCGTPAEAKLPKPGNRGKRDSQIILMSFLQKVMFDERMTELEYDMFNGLWNVTGISPDYYEIILMVDADTKVFPDSLTHMVSAMVKDPEIMGLCGETKIANKADSWVTMIQVFEYYISHHQAKAFESVFGGVTCLPGCFSMYRIKAPKGGQNYWVPILANPDIVEHYSENVVDTLHKKNLLLLGEDRYLTTLMLRTFPKRKQVFVPQAVCKTTVPDEFKVLLSQRRRWINSTVHNLFELVLVRDLCGTFCFSMQFVVFVELIGTLVLPAAISFTFYVVIVSIVKKPVQIIPLVLLALILGLPGVLIVITANRFVYVLWMLIYLISLPVWNFVLPVYAYWKFDDFSWGDTRKTAGDTGKDGHGDEEGEFDSSKITMKRWRDFEKERRMKMSALQSSQNPSTPSGGYTYPGGYDTYSDY
ncbi:chitin synthase [Talaromyces islandicus]|uniref:chitin synthase n=1 Tax=Talaromyces islandicus TaxID=28573 RepID=A0A0U1M7T3_TALIS|nr:chitin synthase [Talaromyces islandicus]